jgi:serine/threonine protein phosphatase PrpC
MVQPLSFSEAGGHPINEDAFVLLSLPDEPEGWLICLADGQGGRAGGREAAQLACRTVSEEMARRSNRDLGKPRTWVELLGLADQAVATDTEAGFTTLIGLGVANDRVTGASSGDSAVLAISGSGSVVELTVQQFKNPPVGSGGAQIVPFSISLVRPWRLLVMSDGVWKYVGWPRVRELATELAGQSLLDKLQNAAQLKVSGKFPDDFTVVLLEAAA